MSTPSSRKADIALAFALLLLCLGGIAAGWVIFRLYAAQALVRHTLEVEVAIGDLESKLTDVGRSRVAYTSTEAPESLSAFSNAVSTVGPALARIRELTRDNPSQQALCDRLEANANQRIAASQQAIELKGQTQSSLQKALQANFDVARTASDTAAITQEMKQNEETLLEQRTLISNLLFRSVLAILAVSFVLSAFMFWLHYHLLSREVKERREAEKQLRELSLELMRVQDEEHRRFARELHDGVGQTLAAAKMAVDLPSNAPLDISQLANLASLLDDAILQTRTISYLFHPPLLDEIGFSSAAKWLIEGYAQRASMNISADIPQPEHRLTQNLELTLYRVLQESLNNIQRHSRSSRAEVIFRIDRNIVTLRIKDFGRGIPREKLIALQSGGKSTGVGLLGMKERVREQSGELEIGSHATGTEIVVKIPYSPRMASNIVAAESVS
jgi:signal transduction histidine kinase